jgi:hypothetical protein
MTSSYHCILHKFFIDFFATYCWSLARVSEEVGEKEREKLGKFRKEKPPPKRHNNKSVACVEGNKSFGSMQLGVVNEHSKMQQQQKRRGMTHTFVWRRMESMSSSGIII